MNRLDDLCYKHNEARHIVLDGGYDALLHVDADMVVPMDALERLCAVDADVVYGLYVSRKTPERWLCWVEPTTVITDTVMPDTHWGKVVHSYGAGMGCTLIRRHVLERLAFRTDGTLASDWWFAQDCTNYGYRQAHDLGCICGHIDHDRVLWPDIAAPNLYEVTKL